MDGNFNEKKCFQMIYKKQRIEYLDIARGIAIILMVIGHVVGKGWKRDLIFSFHMPLFIIVSGMFFKEKSFKEFIGNTIKKLIIPYVLTVFIVNIVKFGFFEKNNFLDVVAGFFKQIALSYSYLKIDTSINSIGVLWFMPFLAIIRLFFYVLKKISKEDDILLGVGCLLLSYFGYILAMKKIWLPFSIDIAFACLVFYFIGYVLIKYNLLNKIINNKQIMVNLLIMWLITIKFGNIEIAVRKLPNGLFTYVGAVCGSMVVMKISMIINNKFNFVGKILSWFGKNSMYVLICHYIEMNLIKYNVIFSMLKNKTIKKAVYSITKLIIISIGTEGILLGKKALNKVKNKYLY